MNLDFEYEIQGTDTPELWYVGNLPYTVKLDTIVTYKSLKSLRIKSDTNSENKFGYSSIKFPTQYAKGKTIELIGRIKTKSVRNGYAGIWLTTNNNKGVIVADNMNDRGLTGTNDWQKVSIRLSVDKSTTKITFGSLLTGKGTAWFDGFEIYIDGIKFNDVKPKNVEPTKEELDWLKQHIYPLNTYDPNTIDNKDLEILDELIGTTKVVALGENTHGSSEIFKMKHRIIKYLAQKKGFNIFSGEANMPKSYKLNNYIIGDNDNPIELLKELGFFIWRTKEVLDMVKWMKQYSKSNRKISFTGFDMQFYQGAIKELENKINKRSDTYKLIPQLKSKLSAINIQRNQKRQISDENKIEIYHLLNSIKKNVSKSNNEWLFQNIRMIEQSVDGNKGFQRDKYMAENLLWIKNQNPKSKIIVWAHNGHIKKTGNVMGKHLLNSLGNDYLTIGFTFNKGSYTAVGKNGLSSYKAQESPAGSYEYFFKQINTPIFLLDLRQVKQQNSKFSKWLLDKLLFRDIGALKTDNEFYKTNLTEDFDFIIFINESSNSKLLLD
ncbi:MAG: erythromycin esterase family protein [Chlorobi bacterium]|nr:erythromycin esterase family protein [Chlorobiota bacterium]